MTRATRWLIAACLLMFLTTQALASRTYGNWTSTSRQAVRVLDHPTVESRIRALNPGPEAGYTFAFFGDQRAAADGDWQTILARIRKLSEADGRLLFMVDGGDIVHDGRHTDQFHHLAESILKPVRALPYLVAVGNHEIRENNPAARRSVGTFLGYLDKNFSNDRFYYRKDIGPVRYLFLDSNDMVYGDLHQGRRSKAQMEWLAAELARNASATPTTIALMHHPIIQSSNVHQGDAARLWNMSLGGKRLVDALIDGGVQVVLTGHTHTYERFQVTRRRDGRKLDVINVSGRPRASVLWVGESMRRARDIRGKEASWLAGKGYQGLDAWDIKQVELMRKQDEADQFGVFTVEPGGGLTLEMQFIDPAASGGFRVGPTARIR